MKKRKAIFYSILLIIIIGFGSIIMKIEKNKHRIEDKKTEEYHFLTSEVFSIINTDYGTRFTFKLSNHLESEEEKYIVIQYYGEKEYLGRLPESMPIGTRVTIDYNGELSDYGYEFYDNKQYFIMNMKDIISIVAE